MLLLISADFFFEKNVFIVFFQELQMVRVQIRTDILSPNRLQMDRPATRGKADAPAQYHLHVKIGGAILYGLHSNKRLHVSPHINNFNNSNSLQCNHFYQHTASIICSCFCPRPQLFFLYNFTIRYYTVFWKNNCARMLRFTDTMVLCNLI